MQLGSLFNQTLRHQLSASGQYATVLVLAIGSLGTLSQPSLAQTRFQTPRQTTPNPVAGPAKPRIPQPPAPTGQGRPERSARGGAIQFAVPTPPSGQGRPTASRRGGATRSQCPAPQELTALVPESPTSNNQPAWVGGYTISDRPTVWVRVPVPLTWNTPGRFRLADAKGNPLLDAKGKPYQLWLQTQDKESGVVAINVPATWPVLEVGKTYRWNFTLFCGEDPASSVQGDITRISLTAPLAQQLQQASPREQVRLLAAEGIWYEALTQLAQQRLAAPKDTQVLSDWQGLLTSVQLGDLAEVPVIQAKP